jgi:hypothetical protein
MSNHRCVTDAAATSDRGVITTSTHPGGGIS